MHGFMNIKFIIYIYNIYICVCVCVCLQSNTTTFIIQFNGNKWPDDGRNGRNMLPLN